MAQETDLVWLRAEKEKAEARVRALEALNDENVRVGGNWYDAASNLAAENARLMQSLVGLRKSARAVLLHCGISTNPCSTDNEVIAGLSRVAAEIERLRKRTHEIAAERDVQDAAMRSELAYWHNMRDEVKRLCPDHPTQLSMYGFHGAMWLIERVEQAEARVAELAAELKRQEANAVYSEGQRKGWQKNAARLRDKLEAAEARVKELEAPE